MCSRLSCPWAQSSLTRQEESKLVRKSTILTMKGDLKKNDFNTKLVAAKFISFLQDESRCLGDIPRLLMLVSPTTCRLHMMGNLWGLASKESGCKNGPDGCSEVV